MALALSTMIYETGVTQGLELVPCLFIWYSSKSVGDKCDDNLLLNPQMLTLLVTIDISDRDGSEDVLNACFFG